MKRRRFLKTVLGIAGAAIVGAKVKPAPAALIETPRGIPFLVNEKTKLWQGIAPGIYPELRAPVLDAHGSAITFGDFECALATLRDDADKRAQGNFDANEAYFKGQLRRRGTI
jgi:hypothetical protein